MRHQPRLDGIRAIAVLVVLGFHATSIMPGGWLGVDIFFVLSGYLITSILISERERTGHVDFKRFYMRRLLRLAPAMVAAVVISVPLLLSFRGAEAAYEPWAIVVGVLAYMGNWMQVANPVSLGPLTHTWSLAIEEQFYLFWPPILVLAMARLTRVQTAKWCAGVVLAFVVLRAILTALIGADGLWFATTSRADALLIGALVAILAPAIAPKLAGWVFAASGAFLAAACLLHSEFSDFMMMGGLTLVAALSAAFIITSGTAPLGKFLEWKPLRAIGQVSYGIYLYHYPVFFLINYSGITGAGAYAAKFGLTALLVVASWFLLEKPFLSLKSKFEAKETLTPERSL